MVTLTKDDRTLNLPKLLTDKADQELYDRCIKDGWVDQVAQAAKKAAEDAAALVKKEADDAAELAILEAEEEAKKQAEALAKSAAEALQVKEPKKAAK